MTVILAVFRSRTQTLRFIELMRYRGVQCTVVQTPPEVRVGCGTSGKFHSCDIHIAKMIISQNRFDSFVGFYEWKKFAGQTVVRKL
jgi:hypothetical protein